MHRFEPDLDDGLRSLDRIKTDELDSFSIAIYCEQNHRKILRIPWHLLVRNIGYEGLALYSRNIMTPTLLSLFLLSNI